MIVSPLKIHGKKTKLVKFILSNIDFNPKKQRWVEPFCGSCQVGFNSGAKEALFVDNNPHISNLFNFLKNANINDIRKFLECEGQKLSRTGIGKNESYYYDVRNRFNKYHDPLDFLFLSRSNFNGFMRFNSNGGYNVPFGRIANRFTNHNGIYIDKIINQIKSIQPIIQNYEFACKDWKDIKYLDSDFVYYDPPYIDLHSTYFGGWNDEKAKELSYFTKDVEFDFAVSMWYKKKDIVNNHVLNDWKHTDMKLFSHYYQIGSKIEYRHSVDEALLLKKNG